MAGADESLVAPGFAQRIDRTPRSSQIGLMASAIRAPPATIGSPHFVPVGPRGLLSMPLNRGYDRAASGEKSSLGSRTPSASTGSSPPGTSTIAMGRR